MNETTETAADAAMMTADARGKLGLDPAGRPACPPFPS
jgi:hypothetical protein